MTPRACGFFTFVLEGTTVLELQTGLNAGRVGREFFTLVLCPSMAEEPLRILYLHHNSDIYGSSRCLLRLVESLDRKRFAPLILLADDGPLRQMIETLNIPVVLYPHLDVITRPIFRSWRLIPFLLCFPMSVFRLRSVIRENRIDLVHTNTGVIVTGGLASVLAGVPHVWHIREWFQEFRAFWDIFGRYILATSTRVICISKAVADQFPSSQKITVVHDGLTLETCPTPQAELRKIFRDQFDLRSQFVVGCIGRIKFVRKGQEVLVRAASLLSKKGLRATYLIVGAPFKGNESHLDDLKKLIHELRLEDQVILAGEMDDPRPAYAAMDLFVLPSAQPEPFGLVVAEAMSMGLPVIATKMGGPVEQVAEGETGFLIPPGDPQALADKIELLMGDAELRRQMSEAAPLRVKKHFSAEQMVLRTEAVYREIAKR